ncbi:MAG: hypothetical protein IID44_08610 [Planctomycetes bacterium]|nr:hypothetical protein [Planctomycetota bacterium]
MKDDPIVEEIRAVRRAHAAKFNNDISAIVEDIRRMERESGRQYVNFPPRRVDGDTHVSPPASAATQ